MRRAAPVVLAAWLVASPAAAAEQAVSAFAASVGARGATEEAAQSVTLYVVPDGRTLLVTDVLVANHGLEVGPLYLSDSQRTRCSIELLQTILLNGAPGGFSSLTNPHTTFSSGIPFGPGEPVIATLAGGSRGVDVTITGKLVPGPRVGGAVRLPGGARGENEGAVRPGDGEQ
jgi:hypothetical protein